MATFVLISGAWHSAWCWERVVPLLEGQGHRVLAPDLLGMAPGAQPQSPPSVALWTEQVAELIEKEPHPVVLVGHSRGGLVIGEVAEQIPDRISKLVYVAAFLLARGETIATTAAKAIRGSLGNIIEPAHDGFVRVRPGMAAAVFYNTTSKDWVARAEERLMPEPMSSLTTAAKVAAAAFGQISRNYIECSQDNAVPLERQRAMQAELPCERVLTLDCDHSPFYSASDKLVGALHSLTD